MMLTKTIYAQLTDAKAIVRQMQEACSQIDPEYGRENESYQSAVAFLEKTLPQERIRPLHTCLDAMEASFAAAVLFLGCQGLRLNLDIFQQRANAAVLNQDFEELHQEYRLASLPAVQAAQREMDSFCEAARDLTGEQRDCMDRILDYDAYLKTLGYKLAHYLGFRFGEAILPRVVPGYVCSYGHSSRYQMALEDYLKADLSRLGI